MDDDVAVPVPLESVIRATPRSLRSSGEAREAWTTMVGEVARRRISGSRDFTLPDHRPLSVTILCFPPAPMQGDVDSIVKPLLDGMRSLVHPDDHVVALGRSTTASHDAAVDEIPPQPPPP